MHGNTGSRNGNWKGGVQLTPRGYRRRLAKGHPHADRDGYVMEHRLVMEASIGRYLLPHEVVHHLNRDKLDNRLENLELVATQGEHLRKHRRGRTVPCHTCGKQVYRRPGDKGRRTFCSQSCVRLTAEARQRRWESDAL